MAKKEFLSAFSWTFGLNVISAILQIGTLAILGRLLKPIDFGTMGILVMIIGFSKIFSEFGLGAALIQKTTIDKRDQRAVMSCSLLLSGCFSLIFFFLSENISVFFANPYINYPLKVISVVFIIDSAIVIQNALAQKYLYFKFISIATLISYVLGNSLTIILAYFNLGVWSLVAGYIFSSLSLLILFVIKFGIIFPTFNVSNIKSLISYSSYFTLGRVANYFANNGDYFVIGKILGSVSLGYYTRAYQMMSSPANLLGTTLQKILFPTFAKIKDHPADISKYFLTANLILAYISLIVSVIVYSYASLIVKILLGPGWELTIFPLKILTIGLVFRLGYKLTTPIMNAIGLVKTRSLIEIIYFITIIIGSYIGSFWGINGASVGVLTSLMINFILSNYFCIKYLKIRNLDYLRVYLKPFIVSVNLILLLYLVSMNLTYFSFYLFLCIGIFYFLFKKNVFRVEFLIVKNLIK